MTYTEFILDSLPTSPSIYELTKMANGDLSSRRTTGEIHRCLLPLSIPAVFTLTRKGNFGPPREPGRNLVLLSCPVQAGCGDTYV